MFNLLNKKKSQNDKELLSKTASLLISGIADLFEIRTGHFCDIASKDVNPNTSQYEEKI